MTFGKNHQKSELFSYTILSPHPEAKQTRPKKIVQYKKNLRRGRQYSFILFTLFPFRLDKVYHQHQLLCSRQPSLILHWLRLDFDKGI